MGSKNKKQEKCLYYSVLSNCISDCELAVDQAIAIAKESDEKITLLISKLNYDILKTNTSIMSKIVSFASKKNEYNGCGFTVSHGFDLNDISSVVLVYDTPCGEMMRMVYNSAAKDIILIPINKLDWELFCQTMKPILIKPRKEVQCPKI